MESIIVKAPSSVANLGCGFDILGFAMAHVADEMKISKNDKSILRITKTSGFGNLPIEPRKNVATVAVQSLLDSLGVKQGFDFEIDKKTMPGSGIGSSAASSAAAVVGVNHLLGKPFSKKELVQFVMKGEELASGALHADNAAPATLGGITLIHSIDPLHIVEVPVPKDIFCILLHPQIEIKTIEARKILKKEVELKVAIKQWGNVASLMAGFYTEDYELIGRSLTDYIIEPQRSKLIQGYDALKESAMKAGALGCNISGSGPSVFALAKGKEQAEKVKEAMQEQYKNEGIDFNIFISSIHPEGTEVFEI